jgi:hypothetical protein
MELFRVISWIVLVRGIGSTKSHEITKLQTPLSFMEEECEGETQD